ncbi:MAG: MGMT family protein [Candidatus Nanopelagicales bacterium]|nr:MGMT family protein [Candidatus Nanopelagicales bacterium]
MSRATNPEACAGPCHRAIRGDGSLAGYRWGLEAQAALLDRERRTTWPRNGSRRICCSLLSGDAPSTSSRWD